MNAKMMEDVVSYIEKTSALLGEVAMKKQAAAQRAPEVVDVLIKRGFLEARDRARAIVAIQDPVKAMESLKKTAEQSFVPPPTIGRPAQEKHAAGKGTKSEADLAFERGIGLA